MYFTTIALRHHTDLKLVSQLVESGEARVRRAHDQRRRLGDAEEPPDGLQGYSDMTSTQKDKGVKKYLKFADKQYRFCEQRGEG